MNRLQGKVSVVTGGAQGIGRAIVEAFVQEGATVAIVDHPDEAKAEVLAQELRAAGGQVAAFKTDVSVDEAVKQTVEAVLAAFGQIDILVNNAGITQQISFLDMTPADWDRIMNVNLRGTFLMTRHVVPVMQRAGSGCVINMASQMGQRGAPRLVHYCASKAGIIGFTKSLARELAPTIRVNAIAPGPIHTRIIAGRDPSWYEQIESEMPLGKIGTPEEVAPTAVFLASQDGVLYTGQTLGPNMGHVML